MRKIKILRGFIIALCAFVIIVRLIVGPILLIQVEHDDKLLLVISKFPFLLFAGLIFIERGLHHIIKNGYFNIKSAINVKRGGLFLIISGVLSLIRGAILLNSNVPSVLKSNITQNISEYLLISIVGFGLIIISDFIKKGNQIQQENDLTI